VVCPNKECGYHRSVDEGGPAVPSTAA